jgi:hypothetical protein
MWSTYYFCNWWIIMIKASNINAFWAIDSSSRDNAWWWLLISWNLLHEWLYCGVGWQYHQWECITLTHTLFLLFWQMSYHCVLWISTHFQHCQTQLHIYCKTIFCFTNSTCFNIRGTSSDFILYMITLCTLFALACSVQ